MGFGLQTVVRNICPLSLAARVIIILQLQETMSSLPQDRIGQVSIRDDSIVSWFCNKQSGNGIHDFKYNILYDPSDSWAPAQKSLFQFTWPDIMRFKLSLWWAQHFTCQWITCIVSRIWIVLCHTVCSTIIVVIILTAFHLVLN